MNTTPASNSAALTRPIPEAAEERATAFAKAVHAQLSDLPSEERDELLDGFEADLVERFAEGGEPGDPESYAAELRRAAGLPPRTDPEQEPARRRTLRERVGEFASGLESWVEATPTRHAIREFARSLRPVWWVLRGLGVSTAALLVTGFTVYFAGLPYYPRSMPLAVVLGVIAVAVSVQWGRGKWLPQRWMAWLRRIGDVVAIIVIVLWVASLSTWVANARGIEDSPGALPGLSSNSEQQILNVYAYDCAGKLLDGVRLFDQDGHPVTTTYGGQWGDGQSVAGGWDEAHQQSVEYALNPLADRLAGTDAWNVFPLAEERIDDTGNRVSDAAGPFATAPKESMPPLASECPVPESESGPGSEPGSESGSGPGPGSESGSESGSGSEPAPESSADE